MAEAGERRERWTVIDRDGEAILTGARDTTRRVVQELEDLRRNLRRVGDALEAARSEGDDVQRG